MILIEYLFPVTNKSVERNEVQVLHKAFQSLRIKIRLKLKIRVLWVVFKTYHIYLTIDCLYLVKYVLQKRLLGILSFFMKEKVNFIVVTVKEI